jgi:Protein of unknown function (DUF2690)
MYFKKGLIGLMAATALGAGVLVPLSAAAPAFAASCYASSCTGLDPINAGCSGDAETIYTVNGVGAWGTGVLQLRFSPSCDAAWAKISDDGKANGNSIRVQNTLGQWEQSVVNQVGGSEYSDMVDDLGSIESQACVEGVGSACTSWF